MSVETFWALVRILYPPCQVCGYIRMHCRCRVWLRDEGMGL